MSDLLKKTLRWVGAVLVLGLLLLGGIGIGLRLGRSHSTMTQVKSLGPTVSQLEKIGELASARIHVTDVLIAEGEGYRGSWLIKGNALLACDVSRAKILRVDPTTRTAALRLPPLRVTSARIDHEKTKTWSVEKKTRLPWAGGNQSTFRDAAMYHAQQLNESTAASDRHLAPAQTQTELLVRKMYELLDWTSSSNGSNGVLCSGIYRSIRFRMAISPRVTSPQAFVRPALQRGPDEAISVSPQSQRMSGGRSAL